MAKAFDDTAIQSKIDAYYAPLIKINEQINLLKKEINGDSTGERSIELNQIVIPSTFNYGVSEAGDKSESAKDIADFDELKGTGTGGGGKVKRKISRKKNKPYRLRSKKRKSNTKGLNYSQGKIKTKKI